MISLPLLFFYCSDYIYIYIYALIFIFILNKAAKIEMHLLCRKISEMSICSDVGIWNGKRGTGWGNLVSSKVLLGNRNGWWESAASVLQACRAVSHLFLLLFCGWFSSFDEIEQFLPPWLFAVSFSFYFCRRLQRWGAKNKWINVTAVVPYRGDL